MSDYIPEGIQLQILKLLPVKSLLRFRCVCKCWKGFIDSPTLLQEQKPRFLVEECVDYIPQDIQVLILNLFPVKSLLRFRCVCKWWKQLIDSPTFLQDHLAVQKPRFLVKAYVEHGYVVVDPLGLVDTLRGPTADEIERYHHVFGTLHGVVCLYDCYRNLLLWNPSIHKFSSLPLPLDFEWAFNNARGTCYGFWIDPSDKEFKILILCFGIIEDEEEGRLMDVYGILYSSYRLNWISVIPPPPPLPGEVVREWMPWEHVGAGKPVVIGSVAHWGGSFEFRNDQAHQHKTRVIMSYDFTQESFEFIEMPNLNLAASFHPRLCHWQGTLSLMYWDTEIPHRCDIHSRQEGSWVKMFGFNLSSPIEDVFWPLEGMEERGRALVQERVAKLVLYDTRAGCVPLTQGFWHVDVTYDFVETLLFPFPCSSS